MNFLLAHLVVPPHSAPRPVLINLLTASFTPNGTVTLVRLPSETFAITESIADIERALRSNPTSPIYTAQSPKEN